METGIRLEDYEFELPAERIARHPTERRDGSRLLELERATGRIAHGQFREIGAHLRPGDLLVLNDSRVIPARLFAQRYPGGGRIEIFLVQEVEPRVWKALVRPGKKVQRGERLVVAPGEFEARVIDYAGRGERVMRFETGGRPWDEMLRRYGHTPLPPYILKARKLAHEAAEDTEEDRERYQTVYACAPGSVAAPTAGLHFTKELMADLADRGVQFAWVTLHVGPGTFQPLLEEHLRAGKLHEELYEVLPAEAEKVNAARREGRRVIPVGTTSVRVLESACDAEGRLRAGAGATELLIAPGFRFRLADALVTNFHLPHSSLLMLASAFGGRELVLRAYREAIEEGYRFYSYGDAMLIL